MSNRIWEYVAHVAFALAMLLSLPLFAGYTISPSPASAVLPAAAAPPLHHAAALADAERPPAPDVSLVACER